MVFQNEFFDLLEISLFGLNDCRIFPVSGNFPFPGIHGFNGKNIAAGCQFFPHQPLPYFLCLSFIRKSRINKNHIVFIISKKRTIKSRELIPGFFVPPYGFFGLFDNCFIFRVFPVLPEPAGSFVGAFIEFFFA